MLTTCTLAHVLVTWFQMPSRVPIRYTLRDSVSLSECCRARLAAEGQKVWWGAEYSDEQPQKPAVEEDEEMPQAADPSDAITHLVERIERAVERFGEF